MLMNSNKALWRTYLFLVCFSCSVAGAFVFMKWQDVKDSAILQQTYANKLIANSIENFLNKYEAFLGILGDKVLAQVNNGDLGSARQELDLLMQANPELAGLGFSLPDGNWLVATSNLMPDLNVNDLINLKNFKGTQASFMEALNHAGLMMGRTYFMPNIEEWVIPLRHAIRNRDQQVVAVMSLGLKLDKLKQVWFGDSLPEYLRYLMLREDLFRQYATFLSEGDFNKLYMTPLPEKRFEFLIGLMSQQSGQGLSELKSGQAFISFIGPDINGTFNLLTASFNPKYRFYSVTGTNFDILYGRMVSSFLWIMLFLGVFNLGLFWLFRRNIHTQSTAKAALHFQVEHDPLTNLPNRRYLVDHFPEWSEQQNGEFSLLYLDLKNFKVCNDIHGHSMGDQLLCVVAERLLAFFENCLVVRQGGDEFIVLCPVTNDSTLRLRCQDFLKVLEKTIQIEHLSFSIHASIGVSMAPHDGVTLDELLRKADMAMYEAKRRQQNVGLYSEELETRTRQVSEIEHELNHALQNNEFSVVYQPQVDAYSYQVLGIEALIRWNNPKLGFVPPDLFIPVAEGNGLIHEIGHFVMKTALRDAKEICAQSGFTHKLRVSVNVSVSQLFNDDFVDNMQVLLAQYKDQPITFMVEVTESLFIEDLLRAKEILLRAKECGVYISLDDFGTGYSSLSVLSKLPINELKIDRSFVNDILTDEQDWMLARSIIHLCKSLSIPVVAEGVETKAQADRLAAHGCDVFQGYYFSKPLPKEALIAFLQTSGKGKQGPESLLS
jgi:diguanylate cyclase (GGDEF)-like protein